eukprot:TRINITY_DN1817_c0_g1_i2.p1 TRINITY_DN1817_c0_g1~~TRINITY_DN1817_c0_g1_i2.p1  ORF type:complete len:764 (+),score=191.86 TRINITY_DN1817_c0_g1_i2:34-2325(+)
MENIDQLEKSVQEWENQKSKYTNRYKTLLESKQQQFDHIFTDYYEKLRSLISQDSLFPQDVESEILKEEFIRIELLKKSLFSVNNQSLSIVESSFSSKFDHIKLSRSLPRLQGLIRGFLQRKNFSKSNRMKRVRLRIIQEILDTERTYIKNLEVLMNVFYEPLKKSVESSSPLLNVTQLNTIFGDIKLIIPLNQQLFEELQECVSKGPDNATKIGEIFVKMSPALKLYTQYVNNYENAIQTLNTLRKSTKFQSFLKKQSNLPETNKLQIDSFQIMPIQRIPRYELLLRDLLKQMEDDHPHHASLSNALDHVSKIALYINDQKRRNEVESRMTQVSEIINQSKQIEIIQPHRKYIAEGDFIVKITGEEPFLSWVVFFNDVIVITEKQITEPSSKSVIMGKDWSVPVSTTSTTTTTTSNLFSTNKRSSMINPGIQDHHHHHQHSSVIFREMNTIKGARLDIVSQSGEPDNVVSVVTPSTILLLQQQQQHSDTPPRSNNFSSSGRISENLGFQIYFSEKEANENYYFFPLYNDGSDTTNQQQHDNAEGWVIKIKKIISELHHAKESFRVKFQNQNIGTNQQESKRLSVVGQNNPSVNSSSYASNVPLSPSSSSMASPTSSQTDNVTKTPVETFYLERQKYREILQKLNQSTTTPIQKQSLLSLTEQIEKIFKIIEEQVSTDSLSTKSTSKESNTSVDYDHFLETVTEAKTLIDSVREIIQQQFPKGKPGSNHPRQVTTDLIKWYMKLMLQLNTKNSSDYNISKNNA